MCIFLGIIVRIWARSSLNHQSRVFKFQSEVLLRFCPKLRERGLGAGVAFLIGGFRYLGRDLVFYITVTWLGTPINHISFYCLNLASVTSCSLYSLSSRLNIMFQLQFVVYLPLDKLIITVHTFCYTGTWNKAFVLIFGAE